MYSQTIWQKRFAKALACGCLLVASTFPAAPARFPNMHSSELAGDKLAVMIDCGYGAGNIRAYAQALTDKPVKYVINTHYHFDHTANDAYFDAVFMTKESIPYATVPYDSFKGIDFPRDYPVITVQDGYKLNLGNRELTILTVPHPNHAIGDIAILDPTRRILYTGDSFPVTYIETTSASSN